MITQTSHPQIQSILQSDSDAATIFSQLLPVLGNTLQCDRIFLYLRNPKTRFGKATHCWRRNGEFPEILDPDWKPEPASLEQEDPMFAAALRAEPSIFVEDVEVASPHTLNRTFEQENFGHRALIHAHLCRNEMLWGVLQPCIFGQSRVWTEVDRQIVNQVVEAIIPIAIDAVSKAQR
jgi:GAF domain-containing protein